MQVDQNCVVKREARRKQLGLPNRFVGLFLLVSKTTGRFFILLRALVSTTIDVLCFPAPGLLSHHCLLL